MFVPNISRQDGFVKEVSKLSKLKALWSKFYEKIIALLLLAALFVGVMSILALVSGAVMGIFGFRYQSIGSLILFFIIAAVVSYPIGLIAETLSKVLLYFGKISRGIAVPLYLLLDTSATAFGLMAVDYFMKSVSATNFSIVVISFLLALIGVKDIDKKPKGI